MITELSRHLDIKHLRLLDAVMKNGNLSRAAKQLNLTQSALSHQLKNLEQNCQQSLFLRGGKKMVPTAAGERILESSRAILQELAILGEDLQGIADGTEGTIKLSSECYTSYHWLPKVVDQFAQEFPNVQVRISSPVSEDLLQQLANGQIDLAITMYAGPEKVNSYPMFSDELVLLVHPGNKLAKQKEVNREQLLQETLIAYPHGKEKLFKLLFGASDMSLPNVLEMPLTEGILEWCAAGLGVAVMARWAATRYIKERGLQAVSINVPGTIRTWHALTRKQEQPIYLQEFIDTINKHTPTV